MNDPRPPAVLERLRGRLVVSCQAYPGEPLRDPDAMRRMALAALEGGAAGIRAQGLADLRAIRAAADVPLIGLWKDGAAGVVITPTAAHVREVAATGAEIVALDATARPRPDGRPYAESFAAAHAAGALVMADVATFAEGLRAAEAGADVVGTTLSGYTDDSPRLPGPDLELVARLAAALDVPVVAEGRIHSPTQARAALEAGAFAVVVGTAITHPTSLTRWFAAEVDAAHRPRPADLPASS
ncbi:MULTISPECIES: N-acetylmannosamine-6-phosphate 2-epimerase [Kitasatospora]|uniref:Putative N-acetylmannosamine-6-phosphate 2-epimerase n=1 Tax=Kitasatospora setae (strain ATCC 33774 / DSM 43861 / JCM 3304 / KCC A-0304 / NBRC 14216 / KM-6054) TaxID=452652 RepID=E4N6M4_KITSK|nr:MULTISPECIES: N-acetylmannosamine-6-phosphate 2-epimerase [Kitasatospora]BAJ26855.1 putative N-acetylmannosamine-6-phosphate 2-epimerase [Kitasatospora setae KM-6054]